jgi:hypothetical protein
MPKLRRTCLLLLPLAVAVAAGEVEAQGKGKGEKHGHGIVQQGHPKGGPKVKKVWTSDEAVDITRSVLRDQGYEVVRIERRGDVRYVYYRRGNMGRGRGKGPVVYMIVRPASDRIIIERAPSSLSVQINVRLGY